MMITIIDEGQYNIYMIVIKTFPNMAFPHINPTTLAIDISKLQSTNHWMKTWEKLMYEVTSLNMS